MGDREAQRTQQDEELRALRKRCEQLEEEQISAVGSIPFISVAHLTPL